MNIRILCFLYITLCFPNVKAQGNIDILQVAKHCGCQQIDPTQKIEQDTAVVSHLIKILDMIALPSANFKIYPCIGAQNAFATYTERNQRIILYDPAIFNLNRKELLTFVIGHELGHHFISKNNQHLALRRKEELDADYFGGYVMAKMAYGLADTIYIHEHFYNHNFSCEDSLSTHPCAEKRMVSVRKGLEQGIKECQPIKTESLTGMLKVCLKKTSFKNYLCFFKTVFGILYNSFASVFALIILALLITIFEERLFTIEVFKKALLITFSFYMLLCLFFQTAN